VAESILTLKLLQKKPSAEDFINLSQKAAETTLKLLTSHTIRTRKRL
jgi:hypothetical protein